MAIPIRIKRGQGVPATLLRGELAYDEIDRRLFIGEGTSGNNDAEGRPIAAVVRDITPGISSVALADLDGVNIAGAGPGDVLTYDDATSSWVAQAVSASSVAWADITSKPSTFAPSTHASSHHTGGGDAIAPADIGAAAASHTHPASDITSGTLDIARIPTGSTSSTVCIGDDARLDDTRTPTDNTVSTAKIQDDAVTADKIADSAVGTPQIADGAVTMAKIAQAGATSNQVIKWNGSAWAPADDATATGSSGAPSEAEYLVKSSDGGLSAERVVTDSTSIAADWSTSGQVQLHRSALTGDVTAAANSNETAIANGAVTYAKIQDVSATDKILGRATAGAGDVEEITCTAAGRALLADADAAAQRTTLGLGSAATSASTDFVAASAISSFGENLLSEESAESARTTLGLGSAATSATSAFAAAAHSHAWSDITSGVPSSFTPSAHNHTVTLEISGFIEEPEAKTYIISPSLPAAITITQFHAQTSAGTVDLAVHDDGTLVTGCSLADAGTTLASLASAISESVAAGSKLALVVSDLQSTPADLAFTIHYTVASANNA